MLRKVEKRQSPLNRYDPLASSPSTQPQFLPSSAVDRFRALHKLGKYPQSLTPPPCMLSSKQYRPLNKSEKILPSIATAAASSQTSPSTSKSSSSLPYNGVRPSVSKIGSRALLQEDIKENIISSRDNKANAFRSYDPLLPPRPDTYKYIGSTRLLQNTRLVRALFDPQCANIQLVERDVEYLRAFLPNTLPNRLTTRIEADIILDEKTAIILYPLREIGQSTAQDPNAGLNELVATIARIGPRYKALWLILEENNNNRIKACDRSNGLPVSYITNIDRGGSSAFTMMASPAAALNGKETIMTRVDPYPGPVTVQLNKLLAWLPFTYNRCGWQRRQSNAMNNDDSCGYQRRWDHQGPQGYYLAPPLPHELPDVNELEFEVKVLFASDEQCAAWMARAIGEEITTRIENEKRMGIRREQDGWQDREEWVWRDWLNEQDST
ncbi:hypothetical protein BX616_002891, partial [Lobosporangium transversale]